MYMIQLHTHIAMFPVYIYLGSWRIHPHLFFEIIGYTIAFRFLLGRNLKHDVLPFSQRSSIIVGALIGAALGAKILVILQYINLLWNNPEQFLLLFLAGKTIVGALLGGVIGVEITKKIIGVKQSTGDVFVYPLIIGNIFGRIGCFLTGLSDHTYGIPTQLPWGVDFGDGILRHPTQIYEIIFLILLMIILKFRSQFVIKTGQLFQFYLISYLGFRFLIDFLKPGNHLFLGLTAIQIACILGLIYYYQNILPFFRWQTLPISQN